MCDSELLADLVESLCPAAREAEPAFEDVPLPGLEELERTGELGRSHPLRRRLLGLVGLLVLDQVAVHVLAVTDGCLEAQRVLDQLEQLPHPRLGQSRLDRELPQE